MSIVSVQVVLLNAVEPIRGRRDSRINNPVEVTQGFRSRPTRPRYLRVPPPPNCQNLKPLVTVWISKDLSNVQRTGRQLATVTPPLAIVLTGWVSCQSWGQYSSFASIWVSNASIRRSDPRPAVGPPDCLNSPDEIGYQARRSWPSVRLCGLRRGS